MFREYFANLPSTLLPIVTMFFFMGAFLLALSWSLRRKNSGKGEYLRRLPLGEEGEELLKSDAVVVRRDAGEPSSGG